METKLARTAEIAKRKPKEKFTSLYHLINQELLAICHRELSGDRATGLDGVTKAEYEENLTENLTDLVNRLAQKSYRPQPVRRVFIPKGDGTRQRPLGIPAYEDKLVQRALHKILEPIFEQDFLTCSYGFRPDLKAHDALTRVNRVIQTQKVGYVVDADIRGFFDHVDHQWLERCLEQRIKDPNIIRLVHRFLKAGVMVEGEWEPGEQGTIQGGNLSPLLANIYLHCVLDLWFDDIVKKHCQGETDLIRYADDFVVCFQYQSEAQWFFQALRERLAKFGLEIAEEKSAVIAFGRFAARDARNQGRQKPATFDFLGMTFYCSTSQNGWFRVKCKTSQKKYRAKVKQFNQWMKRNRQMNISELMNRIRVKLRGHYAYYGVMDNSKMLWSYRYNVTMILMKWLNRRSQRRSYDFPSFNRLLQGFPLPKPVIVLNFYA